MTFYVCHSIKRCLLVIFVVELPDLRDVGLLGAADGEVGEGDGRVSEVTAAPAASAAVQPGLVTAHVPQREHGHDVVQVVAHPLHVVGVVASSETGSLAVLLEVVIGLGQEVSIHDLSVRDPVLPAGVDGPAPAVLTSNARTGIGSTAGPVTAGVLVRRRVVTGVDGHTHGLVIALESVVLRTPVTVDKVCVTVVDAPLSRVGSPPFIAGHVDPVHGCVTLAAHAAHVNVVGPHLVSQVGLPVHEGVRPDVGGRFSEVDPATSMETEPIVEFVHIPWTGGDHVHISVPAQQTLRYWVKMMMRDQSLPLHIHGPQVAH